MASGGIAAAIAATLSRSASASPCFPVAASATPRA